MHSARLGFGCSALLGRSGRRESLRALAAAWDLGLRFFDTARSYGYGEAESLLGEFLGTRRDQAIIATKFGILASPQAAWKRLAKSAARKLVAAVPSARAALQKGAASQFTPNQFTLPVLAQSIDESLRALRTDRVDFLFLHGAPASVLDQSDLLEAMGRLVEAGKVRVAGISAEPDVAALAIARRTRPLGAVQFPCNVFDISAATFTGPAAAEFVLVANHPYGGVARVQQCRELLRTLAAGGTLQPELAAKLNPLDDATFADLVLNVILRDTGIHVVVPAMMRLEHIRANVEAVARSRFTSAELAELRIALTTPLPPG
jgi:D-threo-aldose 1-dehydrogenase